MSIHSNCLLRQFLWYPQHMFFLWESEENYLLLSNTHLICCSAIKANPKWSSTCLLSRCKYLHHTKLLIKDEITMFLFSPRKRKKKENILDSRTQNEYTHCFHSVVKISDHMLHTSNLSMGSCYLGVPGF